MEEGLSVPLPSWHNSSQRQCKPSLWLDTKTTVFTEPSRVQDLAHGPQFTGSRLAAGPQEAPLNFRPFRPKAAWRAEANWLSWGSTRETTFPPDAVSQAGWSCPGSSRWEEGRVCGEWGRESWTFSDLESPFILAVVSPKAEHTWPFKEGPALEHMSFLMALSLISL